MKVCPILGLATSFFQSQSPELTVSSLSFSLLSLSHTCNIVILYYCLALICIVSITLGRPFAYSSITCFFIQPHNIMETPGNEYNAWGTWYEAVLSWNNLYWWAFRLSLMFCEFRQGCMNIFLKPSSWTCTIFSHMWNCWVESEV